MLTEDETRRMIGVGKGTPMGEPLRHYRHPIAAVTGFEDRSTKPVRLMGEDLVVYKDLSGTYGLLELHCAHRRADLSYGYVEETGLRCSYHGWSYEETGRWLAMPCEDIGHGSSRFKDSIQLAAYPVEEKPGLLSAYLGPQPAPCAPHETPRTISSFMPDSPRTSARLTKKPWVSDGHLNKRR